MTSPAPPSACIAQSTANSYPPLSSSTTSSTWCSRTRSTIASWPLGSLAKLSATPLGPKASSTVSFATSTPAYRASAMFLDSPPCASELIGSDNRSGSRRTATAARRQLVGGLLRPQGTAGYAAALYSAGCGVVDNALRALGRSPWKTLRVSHRAALCPQAPQPFNHESNPLASKIQGNRKRYACGRRLEARVRV